MSCFGHCRAGSVSSVDGLLTQVERPIAASLAEPTGGTHQSQAHFSGTRRRLSSSGVVPPSVPPAPEAARIRPCRMRGPFRLRPSGPRSVCPTLSPSMAHTSAPCCELRTLVLHTYPVALGLLRRRSLLVEQQMASRPMAMSASPLPWAAAISPSKSCA